MPNFINLADINKKDLRKYVDSKCQIITNPFRHDLSLVKLIHDKRLEKIFNILINPNYVLIDSTIINRKGSTNENSIPGASGTYVENTKYGKTFERKKVKPIEIGEGCITFDGRFGQTLHFDGHDNTPKIKISTHVDESDGNFRKESIDNDFLFENY